MSTRIAKITVFLNLIIAIGLLMWSVALLTNRADYADKPASMGDEDMSSMDTSNIERVNSKINKWNNSVRGTQDSFASVSTKLTTEENSRAFRSKVFDNRIKQAKTGYFFVQEYIPNTGLIDVTSPAPDPKDVNNPRIIKDLANQPLNGLDATLQETSVSVRLQSELVKSSETLLKNYKTTQDDVVLLNEEINRQKVILGKAIEEGKYLSDRRTNWIEQFRTLENRAKQIFNRINELNGTAK